MRLIDADKFKNQLINEAWTDYSKEAVLRMIGNQPTAHDVDKVVERLENKYAFVIPETCKDIVSIVKGAVKDE